MRQNEAQKSSSVLEFEVECVLIISRNRSFSLPLGIQVMRMWAALFGLLMIMVGTSEKSHTKTKPYKNIKLTTKITKSIDYISSEIGGADVYFVDVI